MEELLGYIRLLLYIGGPFVAIVSGYVGLKWLVKAASTKIDTETKAVNTRIDTLEKECIKELNDVDDKIDRVFDLFEKNNAIREKLKADYLTITDHRKDCKLKTMEINDTIREAGDKIKEQVRADVTEIRTDIGEILKELQRTRGLVIPADPR